MKILRFVTHSALLTSVIWGASCSKLQVALGTKFLSFSGLNVVLPGLGFLFNPWLAVAILCIKKIIGYLWLGNAFLTPFATYIPTLCAVWYWNMKPQVMRFLVPLFCMIAFICHPIGSQAWVFTLYWLIPMALYFVKPKSLFMHTLSATFIQHAVGAVIWLYMVPTTVILWHSLVPLVLVERVLFATGAVLLIQCIKFCRAYFNLGQRMFSFFSF